MARRKKKDEDILERLLKKAEEVKQTGLELSRMAAIEAQKRGRKLKKRGSEKITKGISAAKKIGKSSKEDLILLEKLGKLKKSGIISEKEFQTKKKEILGRI